MYHNELAKMGPVTVTVKSAVLKSRYANKPNYVDLLMPGGQIRSYNCENPACEAFFNGRVNQTVTIVAAPGTKANPEQASIALMQNGNQIQQPPAQQPAPQQQTYQQPTQQQHSAPFQQQQRPLTNGAAHLLELKKHVARNGVAVRVAVKAATKCAVELAQQWKATPELQDFQVGEHFFTSLVAWHLYGIERKGLADALPLQVDANLQPVQSASRQQPPAQQPPPAQQAPPPTPAQYQQPAEPQEDVPF